MIKHIRRWNIWRRWTGTGWFYNFLVLIGLVNELTLQFVVLPEEQKGIDGTFKRSFQITSTKAKCELRKKRDGRRRKLKSFFNL